MSLFSLIYWGLSVFNEVRQFSGISYFKDFWNWIDILALTNGICFLVTMIPEVILETTIANKHFTGYQSGFTCFFLWIKLFYWMRLFKSTAYFVKLITQTINDIKLFSLMVMIVLTAFSSIFYCM
jgi:hypothetical protein